MWQSTFGGDNFRTLLILVAILAAAVIGIFVHSRSEWRALCYKLFRPPEGLEKLSQPGRVVARLSSERWNAAFRDTLERSRRDFGGEGNEAAAAVLAAVESGGEDVGAIVRETALRAMTEGDLRSALVRFDHALVYLLVFPSRCEDRRALARHPALSNGWPAHAANVRAAAGMGTSPMVALLYFLGLDARDGTLMVAFEGDDTRRCPAELADAPSSVVNGPSLTYDFALS